MPDINKDFDVSIFLIMFFCVLGICVVYALFRWLKDRLSPKITTQATVKRKITVVQRAAGNSSAGTYNPGCTLYYVTFCLENGNSIKLRVSQSVYDKIEEGSCGMLRYQGSHYIGFSDTE